MKSLNSFRTESRLTVGGRDYTIYRLGQLAGLGYNLKRIPYSIKILLENLLRTEDGKSVSKADIEYVARWERNAPAREIQMMPARVLLQDFTGVPCVVDLAAMRDALQQMGKDPAKANPLIPVDLVIDHSVQVDHFGSKDALQLNTLLEYQRNRERYALLRWAQRAFRNFRAVPPGAGIVHQVNLEYLAPVVFAAQRDGETFAYPDTVVGTDSHTTMINGLGVLGWGVGGIEAEACMLGQPISMLLPPVVGFRLHGRLAPGATATDLVLTVTEMLRRKGVVGKFVEFYGPGVASLTLADRATISNMSPEYGATVGIFPIDYQTLDYLRLTNRSPELVELVEAYAREQGLFLEMNSPEPEYSDTLELDLAVVSPSLAGPRRPQDRISLAGVKQGFSSLLPGEPRQARIRLEDGQETELREGSVVIAAITSCTNTSNPSVMVGAGLLAKKAVEKGLRTKPWVKTSLAPGSQVVTDYLNASGLMPYLEQLKFHLVGYGCTTCIGNSGPLPEPVAQAVAAEKLVVAAVLSGNRNFEGRISPLVRANYLASPPLVVAYAIAGRVDIDLSTEPLGCDPQGNPVYLKEIWPSEEEIATVLRQHVHREQFAARYATVFEGDEHWKSIPVAEGGLFEWRTDSTYIRKPPYFDALDAPAEVADSISGLRALAMLGDSVTTDHISPAGSFSPETPAGRYLVEQGVRPADFNSYGSRRGNHEVMVRGTLANVRLRNELAPGTEGGWTLHQPSGEQMTIYDAAMRYKSENVPLLIIAGKEYGSGSSRDWAAKGVALLGVKAVIAESFERIHRSNLVGMGVLPLEFAPGQDRKQLGITGREVFRIEGIAAAGAHADRMARVVARRENGEEIAFPVRVRIDTPMEWEYYRHGGILPFVLRQIAAQ